VLCVAVVVAIEEQEEQEEECERGSEREMGGGGWIRKSESERVNADATQRKCQREASS